MRSCQAEISICEAKFNFQMVRAPSPLAWDFQTQPSSRFQLADN